MRSLRLLIVSLLIVSLLIVSLLITPTNVFAQGPEATEAVQVPADQQPAARRSYFIEWVEFRLNEAPAPSLAAEDILNRLSQAAEENGVEVIQTVHLLALEGQQSTAEVGLRTAIIAGVMYPQGRTGQAPPLRNVQQTELGTTLTVLVEPADGEISVHVRYEASRIDGERPEDGPPDIVSFTLQAQLLVVSGQRVLVGGANGASSSYAALTVTEH